MRTKNLLNFILPIIFIAEISGAQAADWIGAWACAPQLTEQRNLPPPPGLESNTLRQVVQVSIGGTKLRVKFSNIFGNGPVTMAAAHLALSAGADAIQTNTDTALTFNGQPSATIPAGQAIWSDPFNFKLAPLADVAITIHFGGTASDVTGHPGSRMTSYILPGDEVTAPAMPGAATMQHWDIINNIDVQAPHPVGAIITLGDSITDGRGSDTDKNDRWPDNLARRLQADEKTAGISVLNQGIGGNTVLAGGLGPTAISRFDRDVLSQSDARWLIIFEGVNDIGGSRNDSVATNLINAFQNFIKQAHAQHLLVYGATITPFGGSFYDNPERETAREAVNNWIRTGGQYDAVLDFDAAVRDPQNPTHLLPGDDSGDHLHPNENGYQALANSIDLTLFKR
ncbi:MAG: SGNH/GDSL hydrolase family protein [Limisphaerales bacterium]